MGTNLKRVREGRDLRQEDVAARARAMGLSWTQATIAAIETGRRALSLGELVLLQGVLNVDRETLLGELLVPGRGVDVVTVDQVRVDRGRWRLMTQGKPVFAVRSAERMREQLGPEVARRVRVDAELALRYGLPRDEVFPEFPAMRAREVASSDAAQRVARAIGRDPIYVGLASLALWGHGLTEERDRLLAKEPGEGNERVRRGHITRRLKREIADKIAEVEGRRRK